MAQNPLIESGRNGPRGSERRGVASPARAPSPDRGRPLGPVAGLCICGGQSRRMGRDKARLEIGGRTLLERALATLSAVAPRLVLATGTRERYAELGYEIALDRWEDAGPLAGLEAGLTAVHEHGSADGATEAFVVVLPCDMPRVDADLLRVLLERAACEPGLSASLLTSAGGPEPLCGVYHTRALPAMRAALEAGQRNVLSFMQHRAADGELPRVLFTSEAEACADRSIVMPALNLNSPEDLSLERARWTAKESA